MIVEYIRYEIPHERQSAFVDAYRAASAQLRASPNCLRYEVSRCTEDPASHIVRIEWDSIDGHLQGFRKGPEFASFLAHVKPFLDQIREMRHYEVTDVVSAP